MPTATDQPRTTQIPELEDDANAVAVMNALSSTDPAVATYKSRRQSQRPG